MSAQQAGSVTPENHPQLPIQICSKASGCQTASTSVTLDANFRYLHNVNGYNNCYNGGAWDATLCPDPVTCAQNCALDGADYANSYGVHTQGNQLSINFITYTQYGKTIGSRLYLLANDQQYQLFHLKNREFSMDVDISQLPCGLNGAVYFVEMAADGGVSKYLGNKAGAKFGTGKMF